MKCIPVANTIYLRLGQLLVRYIHWFQTFAKNETHSGNSLYMSQHVAHSPHPTWELIVVLTN